MSFINWIKGVYDIYRNLSATSESLVEERRNNLAKRIVSAQVDREGFCGFEPSPAYVSSEGQIRRGSYQTQDELISFSFC